jgi:hypothetical protein
MNKNNLTEREREREQNRSWFRFRRWMIPILSIGIIYLVIYLSKLGLINEKSTDSFFEFAPFLLWPSIVWLIIELFIWVLSTSIREGNENYFNCQICHKQFYKDYQAKKDICKDCYKG